MTTEVAQAATIGAIRIQAPTSRPNQTGPLGPVVVLLEASAGTGIDFALAHLGACGCVGGAGLPLRENCWWSPSPRWPRELKDRIGRRLGSRPYRGLEASCGEPAAPAAIGVLARNGWTSGQGRGPGV